MCMSVLPGCWTAYYAYILRQQNKVLAPLKLELWMAVRHHVGAGSQTQIFCKQRVLTAYQLSYAPTRRAALATLDSHLGLASACLTPPYSAAAATKKLSKRIRVQNPEASTAVRQSKKPTLTQTAQVNPGRQPALH